MKQQEQHQAESLSQDEELSEDENLNEELYDSLMETIQRVWPSFELTEGLIDIDDFKEVMVDIAKDQQLFEGSEDEVKGNTIFFTPENLQNIFS